MSNDKVRAEFETWASRHYYLSELSTLLGEDGYAEPEMAYAWDAWQASRAALEVHLPPLPQEAEARAMHYACRRAVERVGVRVKP